MSVRYCQVAGCGAMSFQEYEVITASEQVLEVTLCPERKEGIEL